MVELEEHPEEHKVRVLGRRDGQYEERGTSAVLRISAAEVARAVTGPRSRRRPQAGGPRKGSRPPLGAADVAFSSVRPQFPLACSRTQPHQPIAVTALTGA